MSNLSYKKIGKIPLVNAPNGRLFLLASAYCCEIDIIFPYRHTISFQIVILKVSVQCVNSYLMALKDFEYVHFLEIKRQFTSKVKTTSRTRKKRRKRHKTFRFDFVSTMTFEYWYRFGNFCKVIKGILTL